MFHLLLRLPFLQLLNSLKLRRTVLYRIKYRKNRFNPHPCLVSIWHIAINTKYTHAWTILVTLYLNKQKFYPFFFTLFSTKELAGFIRIYLLFFLLYCVNLTWRDKLHRKVGEIRDEDFARILKRKLREYER